MPNGRDTYRGTMSEKIRVGILGDFNEEFNSHWATTAAVKHAAVKLGVEAERVWIPTPTLLTEEGRRDGIVRWIVGFAGESLCEF
jgi:CTP synthase (UTP-ammonia lyase)